MGKHKSPASALELLLRDAVEALPKGLVQDTALGIYRLNGDPGDGNPIEWRRQVKKNLYPYTALNTYNDEREPQVILAIAAEIQVLLCTGTQPDGVPIAVARITPALAPTVQEFAVSSYVSRPELDGALAHAANEASQGCHRIFIAGDAGVGKTAFLSNALGRSAASRVIWLDASTYDRLYDSIVHVLTSAGLRTTGSDRAVLRADFAQHLREQNDWRTVVAVDDYDDPDLIYDLVPADVPCIVIATSRLQPSDPSWPCVVVTDMTEDEAIKIVRSLLPDADEPQARGLALALGCRPRLIEDACSYMAREPSISVTDLTQLFATNTVEALDAISSRTVDHLTGVYRNFIDYLTSEHPTSLRLLELLVFASAQYAPKEYLGSFLLGKPYLTAVDASFAYMRLGAALRPLVENCLVKEASGMVVMPFLVQAVLQNLLHGRLDSVAEEASHLRASRGQLYGAGWTLGSVASRFTCESILKARVEDQRTNRIGSFLASPSGSTQWISLVGEAWGRTLSMETLLLIFLANVAPHSFANGNLSFKALLPESYGEARAAVRNAPHLFREDVELSINISRALVKSHLMEGFNITEASREELRAKLDMEGVAQLFERYSDSPDGPIDLSILIDWVSEGGAEKFRAAMREMFPEMEEYG